MKKYDIVTVKNLNTQKKESGGIVLCIRKNSFVMSATNRTKTLFTYIFILSKSDCKNYDLPSKYIGTKFVKLINDTLVSIDGKLKSKLKTSCDVCSKGLKKRK